MRTLKSYEGELNGKFPYEVMGSDEPVLLKGLVKNWPIVSSSNESVKASRDYLAKYYTGGQVNAAVGDEGGTGAIFYDDDLSGFNFRREKRQLDELMDDILDRMSGVKPWRALYVDSVPLSYCMPRFQEANSLEIPGASPRASLWVGNQTRVSAHYDIPDNVACVVAGHRRFTLFPPDQLYNLYPGPLDFNPAGQSISMVDPAKPDFQRFPKFRDALESSVSAELSPGDAIFIPSMWWHQVESLDGFNVLINYWWHAQPHYLGSPLDALNHALMSVRSLPKDERDAWRDLFDYYVFDFDESDISHIPAHRLGVLGELDETLARRIRAMLLNRLNQ